MKTALVSDNVTLRTAIRQELATGPYQLVFDAEDVTTLMKAAIVQPDLMLICQSELEMTLMDQINIIMAQHPIPIVLFTNEMSSQWIGAAMVAGVSAYESAQMQARQLQSIITVACHRFTHTMQLQGELNEAKIRLEERKLIDKAKGLIMAQQNCTEDQAYVYLRTSAMNQHCRLADVAQKIITMSATLKPSAIHFASK